MKISRTCTFCGGVAFQKITQLTAEQRADIQAWLESFKDGFHTGHCPHLELPTYACEKCLTNYPEVTRI